MLAEFNRLFIHILLFDTSYNGLTPSSTDFVQFKVQRASPSSKFLTLNLVIDPWVALTLVREP